MWMYNWGNKKARIVIFFYEDTEDENGNARHGRNRNVLVNFIEDFKLKSLQSDDYNVYTHLNNELIEYLAHMPEPSSSMHTSRDAS